MESTTKNLMNQLSSRADLFLLVSSIGSFLVLIVFKAEYYHSLLAVRFYDSFAWFVGAFIASLIEFVRFSLMLASTNDAKRKRYFSLVLGVLGSAGFVVYEFYLCSEVGALWNLENDVYINMLKFLVAIGLVLELRLCLITTGASSAPIAQDDESQAQDNKAGKQGKKSSGSVQTFPFFGLQDKSSLNQASQP